MGGRYFRKRPQETHEETSTSDSSSDEEINVGGQIAREKTLLRSDDEIVSEIQPTEESDTSESTTSSSEEEEEEVRFQRPVFLTRKNNDKRANPHDEISKDSQEPEFKKRNTLLKKVEDENRIIQAREEALQLISANYSTDEDLLRRAMLLNDNDTINSENEKQAWSARQELRKKLRRDKLIAKQLEVEEYEANKLKSQHPAHLSDLNNKNASASHTHKLVAKDHTRQYKPERAKDTRFAELNVSTSRGEDTEYTF